jgi:hypothetical protein
MAKYFMCCNGLYQKEDQIKNNLSMAVFPSLHSIQDAAIAKKIIAAIRNICLHCSAKRTRTSFLPGFYARVPSLSWQRTVQSLIFRHVLGQVTVLGFL